MRRYFIAMVPVAAAALAVVLLAAHFTHTQSRVTHTRVTRTVPVWTYADTFRSTVNAYAQAHGGEPIRKVTCLRGNPGHYFCAFVLKAECRGAFVEDDNGEVNVVKAGKVGYLTPARCTARNVFRYVPKG